MGHCKKASHWFVNALLEVILPLVLNTFGRLSSNGARRCARVLGWFLHTFYRPGVRLVRANLRVAFPELPEEKIRKLTRKNFLHTAWLGIDFLRLLHNPRLLDEFLPNLPPPDKTPHNPQYIFCLPHFGSWEVVAQAAPRFQTNCAAVSATFSYPVLNRVLLRSREVNGLKLIPQEGAVRGCLRALHEGTSIGMLIDQNLSPRHGGIFVNFFGLPATTSPLPAILSERMNLPVYSGACVRQEDGRYEITMEQLEFSPNATRQERSQTILAANERLIR
ncbi:MAG: lysophospholipid acyltransferase family protein, partial [Victivallales bacterium]|nr:lysophospholipid acyltransferase family protein [Victivallales bacterium]